MLTAAVMVAALAALPTDPVDAALVRFRAIEGYRVTLRSGDREGAEVIRYRYRKPGFVRMDFVHPHKGAVLVYDPEKRVVRLRPFSLVPSLVLTLAPDNRLVKSARGHRVDASDLGSLLLRVRQLQEQGTTTLEGVGKIGGREVSVVSVAGRSGQAVDGVHRYRLWLDRAERLPLRVEAFAAGGRLLEAVAMEDLEIDPPLPDELFTL
jgi:outer membrane lipoprotein-sorting protein